LGSAFEARSRGCASLGCGVTTRRFASAWRKAVQNARDGVIGEVPDIQWRAHVACWCASNALRLDGDFVDCGVATGLLAGTICDFLQFQAITKTYWLFDTWSGLPIERFQGQARERAERTNQANYKEIFHIAQRNFAGYPNAKLVRGILPDTLSAVKIEKISYLSIDLNDALSEDQVIRELWPKIITGGFVLLDDYGFAGFEEQHEMWDRFAVDMNRTILTLPTGQGLLLK
jgi:O-methyltransferase